MIAVGITTAPRADEHYLVWTIRSLEAAGFEAPFLISAEPDTPLAEVPPQHEIHVHAEPQGEWRNTLWVIGELARRCPNADAVMLVQDDVIFCRGVEEVLRASLWPSERCGAIQVYTSRRYRGRLPRGLGRLPLELTGDLNSACAIAFRPKVAVDLVDYAQTSGWRGRRLLTDDPAEIQETDTFIGQAMVQLGWEVWCFNPSLGFHVAKDSTLGHGGPMGSRQGLDFPGEEADAMEIMR